MASHLIAKTCITDADKVTEKARDFRELAEAVPGEKCLTCLLCELTTPQVLAGIVKIIRARAPALIKSRKIHQRKRAEA
jgi:hypothetical protein